MLIKYNIDIEEDAVKENLNRLINQIYKLLPNREENIDWIKPLENIIEEFSGMKELIIGNSALMFQLLCKLEGLMLLTNEEDFGLFRKTIFECLTLVGNLKQKICLDYKT